VPEPADAPAEGDAEPAEPAPERATAATERRSAAAVLLAVAAAVFAVTAVVLLVLFLGARKDHDTLKDELTIRTTASRFAEAFVALDSSGPLPDQDAVVSELGTGTIIAQHTQAMASLREAYKAFNAISARADIKANYVSQVDEDTHEATVIVNLVLNVVGSTQSVPNESYLEVHLVKLDGKWKVDNVVDVRGRLGPQPTTPSSTTTTAPAASTEPPLPASSG
jgi:hypothetical protein